MSNHERTVPFALAQVIDQNSPARIVACVNACEGIENPANARCNSGHQAGPIRLWDCPVCVTELRAQRDALFEAAKLIMLRRLPQLNFDLEGQDDMLALQAAIAKAEGRAP
jgi:hypothetical protein